MMTLNDAWATNVKIDWLTAHVSADQYWTLLGDARLVFEPTKPRWGYRHGLQCQKTGLLIYIGTYTDPDDCLLVASGQVLDNLRVQWEARTECQFIKLLSGLTTTATRLDVAVDVYDGGAGVDYLADSVGNGGFSRRNRKEMVISSEGPDGRLNRTVYAGKRPNRLVYRAYHKPVNGGGVRSRHEVEHHGETADAVWLELWSKPCDQLLALAHRSLLEVVAEDHRHVIPAPASWSQVPMPKMRRSPKMNRREWLERQVLPVLADDFVNTADDEETLIEWLCHQVAERSRGRLE